MVTQKEAVRGKERIQQLMEAFPGAKRRHVITVELDTEGIRPNETTQWLGKWSLPDAPSYFERNHTEMYREVGKSEMGYYFSPFTCSFGDGVNFRIMFDDRSPYEFRYEGNGRYQLYRDGEAIEEVFFPPRPQWYDKKTSSGKPMASIISVATEENSLKLAALTACGYGKDTCRYCNINSSEAVSREVGAVRQTAKQEQDVYETTLAACQERKWKSFMISGGVILDPSKEADMYARLVRAMRRAEKDAGYNMETPLPFNIKSQAMEPEDVMKMKEAGLNRLGFNLEVWDPKLFEWLCPGKTKYVGRDKWLERMVASVEVMGKGNVQSSTVLGLEMAPPHGFKSEDEGAESYLEGAKWLLDHGIQNGGAVWRPAPGTILEGAPAPRSEYVLRVHLAAAKLALK